jgi:hypothetical protein
MKRMNDTVGEGKKFIQVFGVEGVGITQSV